MATNGISSILADIQTYFSSYSSATVQFLMTFPSLFIIIFSFVAAYASRYISKRRLIIVGLSLVILAGTISFVGYKSFEILLFGGAILGSGVGLCSSFAISLISNYFIEPYKSKVIGIQTAAANFGSMLMTFVGGILAKNGWKYNYLVYLLAFPGLLCSLLFLNDKKDNNASKGHFKECKYTYLLCIQIVLFMVFFYIGPTSIAMLFYEKNINSTFISGLGSTLFLLGGAISSLLFTKIDALFKDNCLGVSYLVLTIGFVLMANNNVFVSLIGCCVAGSSISFSMPYFMKCISINEKPENVAIATAMGMAFSNIGTLIAPLFTLICTKMFNISSVNNRVIFASVICFLIFMIKVILKGKNGK